MNGYGDYYAEYIWYFNVFAIRAKEAPINIFIVDTGKYFRPKGHRNFLLQTLHMKLQVGVC